MIDKEDKEKIVAAAYNLGTELLNAAANLFDKATQNLPGEALKVREEIDRWFKQSD